MSSTRVLLSFACLAGLASSALAQTVGRGPKVLLLYDMEGITAADEYRKTTFSHPAQYVPVPVPAAPGTRFWGAR